MFGGWKLSYYTVLAIVVPTYKCLPICTGTRRPHFVSNKYSSRLKIGPFLKRLIAAASSVPIAYDETALKKPVPVTSVSQHLEQKASLTPSRPALQRWREGEGAGGEATEGPWEAETGEAFSLLPPLFFPCCHWYLWLSSGEEGTIWPSEDRRSHRRAGIPGKPMLQRRLVVLPPLLAAVLVTVAGVRRDSQYSGQYSLDRPSALTYLTLRAAAERNICFKLEACLCATPSVLDRHGRA